MKNTPEVLAAYHEAGHAVAAIALQLPWPKRITITDDGAGWCQGDDLSWCHPDRLRRLSPQEADGLRPYVERRIVANLAGIAAESLRRRYGRLVAGLALWGLVGRLAAVKEHDEVAAAAKGHDITISLEILGVFQPDPGECRRWLEALWERARQLLRRNWRGVDCLARALLDQRRLEGAALDAALPDLFL